MEPTGNVPAGMLVYLVNTLGPGPPRPVTYDLVVQPTGNRRNQKVTPVSCYRFTAEFVTLLMNCRYSPNHEIILLMQRDLGQDLNAFRFYFWNSITKQLQPGPSSGINRSSAHWSPDSQYLAYIEGGDIDRQEKLGSKPLTLQVYSLATQKSRQISENPEVPDYVWTRQQTLLYTQKENKPGIIPLTYARERPSIFESPISGGSQALVIENGLAPSPSPDGKYILFTGWPDPAEEAKAAQAAAAAGKVYQSPYGLYLYNRALKKRRLVAAITGNEPPFNVLWSKNSRQFWIIGDRYHHSPALRNGTGGKGDAGEEEEPVSTVQVSDLKVQEVAVFRASEAAVRPGSKLSFYPVGVSNNEQFMYFRSTELQDPGPQSSSYDTIVTLHALRLSDSSDQMIWKVKNLDGYDWSEALPL